MTTIECLSGWSNGAVAATVNVSAEDGYVHVEVNDLPARGHAKLTPAQAERLAVALGYAAAEARGTPLASDQTIHLLRVTHERGKPLIVPEDFA